MELWKCEICGSEPYDHYVHISCHHCGLQGPWTNNGRNDDNADHIDHKNAVQYWNNLQASLRIAKLSGVKNFLETK